MKQVDFCHFQSSTVEKLFKSDPWRKKNDTLTFSSSLPQFFPEVILAVQFRPDSKRSWKWLSIFHLSPFSHPLIPKITRKKNFYQCPFPTISNLAQSFQGLALNLISRILQPPVQFLPAPPPPLPFLILPWSEDYAKQGMRVKGKFSG